MNTPRKAARFALLAVGSLLGGLITGGLAHGGQTVLALAGYLGYLYFGARATAHWMVVAGLAMGSAARTRRRIPLERLAAGLALALLANPATAQQTIFNVPSADVLDPGKVYVEVDELFRPTEPEFSSTTIRGVVGAFPRVEAGINFAGLVSPGPVIPTATLAVKVQPVRAGGFTLTAGGYGLFYLRGAEDGDPAGLGYGFASYRVPKLGTRIEVGGWYASAGFVHPADRAGGSSTGGALATFEQPLPWVAGLTLAADWWSGENAIGYVSPGLIYTFGRWTAYAAYSIKNGDSNGDGGLIELGYAF